LHYKREYEQGKSDPEAPGDNFYRGLLTPSDRKIENAKHADQDGGFGEKIDRHLRHFSPETRVKTRAPNALKK
jgi:hypothetical protein